MFIYLLICIAHNEELDIKPFHVYLSTELAICANLGSSSSFAVCLAACFLHWARLQKGDHDEFDVDDLDKIANYAIDCEEILPNYMFGLDPFVCTHGLITRSQYGENSSAFIDVPRLRILLIDSKIRENKHEQMKRLAELKYGYPTVIKDIFNKIDNLSKTTYRALDEIRRGYEDEMASKKIFV
ncbi:mevalonate kinase [Lasius niger]|uniref:Mevalonate kinase n=1 Tax=Lasius niger TaxID=67767 RepID=A0A0J7KMV4_LASNI|nr:mevalonate kinase [Lasius niger]